MKFIPWLSSLFEPARAQDLNIDRLMVALMDVDVRKHWMLAILDEIKDINTRTHAALMEGKLTEQFPQESARLQGIVWTLRQILDSKTHIDMERHHNREGDELDAAAVLPMS